MSKSITLPTAALAVEDLLRRAGAQGASDLALDPQDDGSLVAIARIDGVRQILGRIDATGGVTAIARLKALAGLPAYITDAPQDGRLDGRPFAIPGDLRLAVLPTVRGGRIALRLPALGALPTPDGLGLPSGAVSHLRSLVRRADGLVLITGPTGSGKSTTIHSLLAELAIERPDRQIVTIEDPVERRVDGLAQVEVANGRGFGPAEALAAALRQDADVLVVGEVRDRATAAACLSAALTGHLVVTTLHCGRAVEAVPRLTDMGVDRDLLLPALVGVLSQRLVRLVHPDCGGRGCAGCTGGWRGRRAVADLLLVDHAARTALRDGAAPRLTADLDRQAADLVAAGLTTQVETVRVIGGTDPVTGMGANPDPQGAVA